MPILTFSASALLKGRSAEKIVIPRNVRLDRRFRVVPSSPSTGEE
jgi:hypothetical protein